MKSAPWARMVIPKELRGLDVVNFEASFTASYLKRIYNLWSNSDSILSMWIKYNYI